MAYTELLKSISLDSDSSIATYTGPPGVTGSASPNSGFQYRFLKVTGVRTVGLATAAANERVIGVLQNKPQVTGQAATVAVFGVSLVQAGGTVAAGDGIKVKTTTGEGITWVAGTDADALRVGVAITGAASGQLFSCLLRAI